MEALRSSIKRFFYFKSFCRLTLARPAIKSLLNTAIKKLFHVDLMRAYSLTNLLRPRNPRFI